RQAGRGPTQPSHRLDGHEPMSAVGQAVRKGDPLEFLVLDPFDQLRASAAVAGVVGEMVDERVGVQEDRVAALEIVEGHGDSRMPKSGSRTMRSSVSTSPVQGIIPAVCRARLSAGRIVTETFSWSFNGNGWMGLRTPFS